MRLHCDDVVVIWSRRRRPETWGCVVEETEGPECMGALFVYYYGIKRELNRRLIYECRCDERLKGTKGSQYTTHKHWVSRGTRTSKDRDEVK